MISFPSESWWFSSIPPHPAPSSLRLQYRMAALLYMLVLGIPTTADLYFNEGSYFGLTETFVVFMISANVAFVVLVGYFIRSEGSSWRPFWNEKFAPNILCLLFTPFLLFTVDYLTSFLFNGLIGQYPRLAAYIAPKPTPEDFPASLVLPLAAAMITSQEITTRAFLMTRIRQSGGSLATAIVWSTALFSLTMIGWGLDVFVASVVIGALLALIYARWGGLVGIILGRFVWEVSNFL